MVEVAPHFRHCDRIIGERRVKAKGEVRVVVTRCKDSGVPWCQHLALEVGVRSYTDPETGEPRPTHAAGDEWARDVVAGRVPLERARRVERDARRAERQLAGAE